jgi:hypothetical protein
MNDESRKRVHKGKLVTNTATLAGGEEPGNEASRLV